MADLPPPPPGPPPGHPGHPGHPAGPPPSGPPPGLPPYGPPPPPPQRSGRRQGAVVAAAVAAALVVLVVAVLVPVLVLRSGGEEGDRTTASEEVEANLDDVQVHEDLRTDHVDEDVNYETVPPVGGPHAAEWLDCGRYDEPVRDENAVHDLEHGAVWITYDPDLDEDDVAALEALLPQNGILSPYDGLPSPVVVTVWERQLALEGPDDPRLPLFLTEFAGGVTAPEPFASCAGGLTDGSGGTGKAV